MALKSYFVQWATGRHVEMLSLTHGLHQNYAQRHKFGFITSTQAVDHKPYGPLASNKVWFITKVLPELPQDAYVVLADADVVIQNPLKDFHEALFSRDHDLAMVGEIGRNINSGVVVMRVTDWLRDFFGRVMKSPSRNGSIDATFFQLCPKERRFAYLHDRWNYHTHYGSAPRNSTTVHRIEKSQAVVLGWHGRKDHEQILKEMQETVTEAEEKMLCPAI